MKLTTEFEDALRFALAAHSGKLRKGTQIPYASHLLAVASIVLDYGGNECQAMAALLHDTIEDCGVDPGELRRRFGAEVADIVVACSDSLEKDPLQKAPWGARKEAYIKHMKTASPPVQLVSAADKLHNIRSIAKDFREVGNGIWERFNASREEILWYYDALVEIFRQSGNHKMLVEELARVVAELRGMVEQTR